VGPRRALPWVVAVALTLALGGCPGDAPAAAPGLLDASPQVGAAFAVDPGFVLRGQADRAAESYARHCASCHGAQGDGAGPAGRALTPPPTDFTRGVVPAHRAFVAIRDGGMAVGMVATMPSFASALDDHQLHDLVAYVQAFGP